MTKWYGKYSGDVVDNVDPMKMGQIRVSVPSVLPGCKPVWARPCLPYGHFFVPPKDTKVWVEFEAGDIGSPLWVGTWYPENTVVPEASAVSRVIHTSSGHLIRLSDDEDSESVLIRHRSSAMLSFDAGGGALLADENGAYLYLNAEKEELTIGAKQGHMITFTDDGITLVHKDGARVEVCDGKVKVTGESVQVLADQLSLAAGSIALGGQAANSAVLGELLVTLFAAHTHGSAMGPTTPPLPGPVLPPQILSTTVKVQP